MSRGRPSKLTPETMEALEEGVQAGLSYKVACEAAGVGYSTFRRWMNAAEEIREGTYEGRYRAEVLEFSDRIKKAKAEGAKTLLALIWAAASEGTWQAAAWILERRHKEHFSLRSEQQVLGAGEGGPVELTLTWKDTPGPLPKEEPTQ